MTNEKQTEAEAKAAAQQAPVTPATTTRGIFGTRTPATPPAAPAPTAPAEKAPETPVTAPATPAKAAADAADEKLVASAARQHGSIPADWYHDAGHSSTQEREAAQTARDEAAGVGVPPAEPED